MTTPKVSVLMPVYNTKEEYLRPAIESILNQTFTDFEFIIVDDGSTNGNIKKVIKSYKDNRIKYFYKENSGIADSLNFGMEKASGEYIARMDSDDISLQKRFEKQVKFLDTHSDISVVGALYERFPEHLTPQLPERIELIDMLKWCAIAHPLVMFRKKDFERLHLLYDSNCYCEDYDLWVRALIAGLKIANIPEVLLKYRWHADNSSNQKSLEMAKSVQKVKNNIVRRLTGDLQLQERLLYLSNSLQNKDTYLISLPLFRIKKNSKNHRFYLFNFIPLLRIKQKMNKKTYYLFGFIPVFSTKDR